MTGIVYHYPAMAVVFIFFVCFEMVIRWDQAALSHDDFERKVIVKKNYDAKEWLSFYSSQPKISY